MSLKFRTEFYEWVNSHQGTWDLVGSKVTCNPVPRASDVDILVYIPKAKYSKLERYITSLGFAKEGGDNYPKGRPGVRFNSWRMFEWNVNFPDTAEEINLIITNSTKFRDSFVLARDVCATMNLLDKNQRILVHKAIIEGKLHVY